MRQMTKPACFDVSLSLSLPLTPSTVCNVVGPICLLLLRPFGLLYGYCMDACKYQRD